ncbi:hypothetical protein chiPu_0028177 [Chiloscyllium punctatum]|uniref:Secreted protein n=1 Tax=Chiloscyllium punctatum TaxID=137246 RepID=A0A401TMU1_CHIPU|nr:hypothetical protein [Chiloscyllium punctatum]
MRSPLGGGVIVTLSLPAAIAASSMWTCGCTGIGKKYEGRIFAKQYRTGMAQVDMVVNSGPSFRSFLGSCCAQVDSQLFNVQFGPELVTHPPPLRIEDTGIPSPT